MDPELLVLATAAGTAVAQAVGTDAWNGVRGRVARLFGRGRTAQAPEQTADQAALEQLDRTAAEVEGAGPDVEEARSRAAASWRTRFEDLLGNLDDTAQGQVAAALRELVAEERARGGATAGDGGVGVSGNVSIKADHGSAAALNMGNVSFGNPRQPGMPQG